MRASVLLSFLVVVPLGMASAFQDLESEWLAKIIKDLEGEIQQGCEYSFDSVSDKWIALNGVRLETWHFTVCGEVLRYNVRYYPKDPTSNASERVEVERESNKQ